MPVPAVTIDLAYSRWPAEWQRVHQDARPGPEQALIASLAELGDVSVPALGHEGPEGIPIDLSWPDRRIAVRLPDMPEDDVRDLTAAGWRVIGADVDAIHVALTGDDPSAATPHRSS